MTSYSLGSEKGTQILAEPNPKLTPVSGDSIPSAVRFQSPFTLCRFASTIGRSSSHLLFGASEFRGCRGSNGSSSGSDATGPWVGSGSDFVGLGLSVRTSGGLDFSGGEGV